MPPYLAEAPPSAASPTWRPVDLPPPDRRAPVQASLAAAVQRYRGPLLEGDPEEWVFEERRQKEQAYLTALETLAEHARARGDHAAAARFLRLAVATDPRRSRRSARSWPH